MTSDLATANPALGVVIIGRNEGERLRRCLDSITGTGTTVIYVDSASTDGSVELARSNGADVVELDMTIPFTAARARNAGFARLRQRVPTVRFVQFVDGDCEVIDKWLGAATRYLAEHPEVACVCGPVKERFPDLSVYHRLHTHHPIESNHEIKACGGIFMIRADVFQAVGGFREDLATGEEMQLCRRIRERGGQIWGLDCPMAWHDAAIVKFGQWWRRTRRTGYTYAQATALYGIGELEIIRPILRSWLWVVVLPMVVLAGLLMAGPHALWLLLAFPLQTLRMASSLDGAFGVRLTSACFLMLGKVPELIGQLQFWFNSSRERHVLARSFDKSSS